MFSLILNFQPKAAQFWQMINQQFFDRAARWLLYLMGSFLMEYMAVGFSSIMYP